tara:strand:- start:150 stop:500 length:351 start_codon:yes stop_codon:yes gene_type:complete
MKKIKLIINNDKNRNTIRNIFFIKNELKTIMNLYARMVSNGSWRDYGLSKGKMEVSFDIYQRASDKPVFKITKNFKPNNTNEKFIIKDRNGVTIEKAEELKNLIKKTRWTNLKIVK